MSNNEFKHLAKQLLISFGITNPSEKQTNKVTNLISNVAISTKLTISNKLSSQEKSCLLLAAHGNSIEQTADILSLSRETVREYRRELRRKLGCRNMAHAVYQGIRYGHINTPANT